ncbi:hypothetical protein Esti_004774 [Eimeria stiedai]
MATLGESKSARKHVGTAPQIMALDSESGDQEQFIPIEKLQNVGINAADINKLRASGYCTVLSVIQTTKKDLSLVKGLSEAKVEKLVEAAMKLELCNSFISGGELVTRRAKVVKITTATERNERRVWEGEQMTFCLLENLSIRHALQVCYIDTEATFRPEKICLIAERFGLDGAGVLDNIMYARAYTTEHMHQLLTVAAAKMSEEKFDRQQKLNKMLSSMLKMSEQFNVCIVLTNQVMSDPGGGLTFVANPTKPVGGHVLGHASTTRLSLRKGKGDQRICKVYDAPNLPESECIFQLSFRRQNSQNLSIMQFSRIDGGDACNLHSKGKKVNDNPKATRARYE